MPLRRPHESAWLRTETHPNARSGRAPSQASMQRPGGMMTGWQVGRLLAVFGLVGLTLGSIPPGSPTAVIVQNPASQISTWEVATGRTPVILMHGYASSPQEWLPFSKTIVIPLSGRFVFPQGPEPTTPPDGPTSGRAWWRLDLAS